MSNRFLRPAILKDEAGHDIVAIVRDPDTLAPLGCEGEWKRLSPFWSCRLRDGDVVDATDDVGATRLPIATLMPAAVKAAD